MATDITALLTDTLNARAAGAVDPATLASAAIVRGRRLRRRRLVTRGVASAAAVLLGATLLASPLWRDAPPLPDTPGLLLHARAGLLPPAPGQPGAAESPELIGRDPRVLHFSVDDFAGSALSLSWAVEPGSERAHVRGEDFEAQVSVARHRDSLWNDLEFRPPGGVDGRYTVLIDGRQTTMQASAATRYDGLRLWSMRWQPGEDLWAQAAVWARTGATARDIARRVRFDTAQRCALPFSLSHLPAPLAVKSCSVALNTADGTAYATGTLVIRDDDRELQVRSTTTLGNDLPGSLAVGPYRVRRDGGGAWLMSARPYLIDVRVTSEPFTERDVLRILGGVRTRHDTSDPSSW